MLMFLSFVDVVDELQKIPSETDESFKHTCESCFFVLIMHSYACALYMCVLEGVCVCVCLGSMS